MQAFIFVLDNRSQDSPPTHPNAGFLNALIRWEKQLCLALDGPSMTFEEYVSSVGGKLLWDGQNRGGAGRATST